MFRTIDDLMYINDGHQPYQMLFMGRGGLGYEPTPYNMVGGFIIRKDENGNIIEARPYNEEEKNNIEQNNSIEDDKEELKKHKIMRKEYQNYLFELKEKNDGIEDDDAGELLDKLDDDVYFLEDNIEYYDTKIDMYKKLEENDEEIEEIDKRLEEQISSSEKSNKLEEEIKLLKEQIELTKKRTDIDEYEKSLNIASYNNIIKYKEQNLSILRGDEIIYREPEKINLDIIAPKDYKYIKGLNKNIYNFDEKYFNGIVDIIKNLQTEYNTDGKNLIDFVSDIQFTEKLKPKGGGEATEEAIIDDRYLQGNIYKKAGFKKDIYTNPNLENLKNIFIDSGLFEDEKIKALKGNKVLTGLPIDLIDRQNLIFNEVKKYENYSFEELKKILYNEQLNPLKRIILEKIRILSDDPNPTRKTLNELKKTINDFTKEENGKYIFDEKKFKNFYHDMYGEVGLPISVKKFGNIGTFTYNKKNPQGIYNTALQSLNNNWNIDIDYNQKLPNGDINPNYGKVVKLYTIDKNKNMKDDDYNKVLIKNEIIDINGNLKKPFEYIFTVATKDKLVVLNYTDFIKKNKINSPLDKFKLSSTYYAKGDDIKAKTDKEDKKDYSYLIPYEDFKEVPKSSFIEPKIPETKLNELLDDIIENKTDINKYDKKIKKKIEEVKNSEELIKFKKNHDKLNDLKKSIKENINELDDDDMVKGYKKTDINDDNIFTSKSKIKKNENTIVIIEKYDKYKSILTNMNNYKNKLKNKLKPK